ncbi:uncharacterized protein LOC116400637 isoform X2 [Anarrhichthys ocellatus]|uniref:uncharacterized protein LOC116400637 isoform X2 n=1 Tax=Anarrhichthys ocellatus TaxID=433405 RepID=UPI0012ED8FC5|nr:uncharacterized protein LOC116400637 isoform X2 [Anarrhichthys ocellatus]
MAALERQREISDMVLIERDRLRDDVVGLRDLLKKHGVVVSPEVSTNGEAGQGEAVDDVTAESALRLAEEPSHGGRENTLGEVQEQQPAEGIELMRDDVKYDRSWISKRSQSLNVTSTSNQTRTLVKGFDKRASNGTGKNEDARKLPRNKGSKKDPTKKFKVIPFRNEGIKKQRMKKSSQMCEPKSAHLNVDQVFEARTELHSEPVSSNQDVLVSFDDQICKIQSNLGGNQLLVRQSEGRAKCVDLVPRVRRAATEKVHKSRLVPPPTRKRPDPEQQGGSFKFHGCWRTEPSDSRESSDGE